MKTLPEVGLIVKWPRGRVCFYGEVVGYCWVDDERRALVLFSNSIYPVALDAASLDRVKPRKSNND